MAMQTKKYRGFEITRGSEPDGNYWTVIKGLDYHGSYLSEQGAKIRINELKERKLK